MRRLLLVLALLGCSASTSAFEVMPVEPLFGAYNADTNQSLDRIRFMGEDKAGICTRRLRQSIGKEGFPVHEAITRDAYAAAHGKPLEVASWLSPLIAGVVWNDDPQYLMRKAFFNGGMGKLSRFQKLIESKDRGTLTGRSHFGDLQYLHAMAPRTTGDVVLGTQETHDAIKAWLKTAYEVSIGLIPHDARAADTPLATFAEGLACRVEGGATPAACTVLDVFDPDHFWREEDEMPAQVTRQLALGAMLHTVQDAFSRSHVQRDEAREGWPVVRYYSYPNDLHCVHDMVLEANREPIRRAAEASRRIAVLSTRGAPWAEVEPVVARIFAPAVPSDAEAGNTTAMVGEARP